MSAETQSFYHHSNIRVIVDSSSDIREDLMEQYGIKMVSLTIHFGEEQHIDRVTITPETFYDRLPREEVLPTTSQPTPSAFLERYEEVFRETPEAEILVFTMSSGLSGTYQSALLAKSLLREDLQSRVRVVDSKSVSMATGELALLAIKKASEGMTFEAIYDYIENIKQTLSVYFMVENLDYLQKGGRIHKSVATIGNILHIKPIIEVTKGTLNIKEKIRGTKKTWYKMVDLAKMELSAGKKLVAIITTSSMQVTYQFIDLLKSELKIDSETPLYTNYLSPVVGCHAGPGLIGFGFMEDTDETSLC